MPFAPSIILECIDEYLDWAAESPFMVETFTVKKEYQSRFPAVTHCDATLRPQTVNKNTQPDYWRLISLIGDKNGNYIVLNTSYNMHGEPIVCSPQDAIETFLKGCVDYLAIGNYIIKNQA